jgi:Flp pilus assembly protein TadB
MKKNVIIGLLTAVSVLSLTYGYVQKERADEQEAIAMENLKVASEQRIMAEQAAKEAERQRTMAEHRAMEQAAMAQKALEDAKRKK